MKYQFGFGVDVARCDVADMEAKGTILVNERRALLSAFNYAVSYLTIADEFTRDDFIGYFVDSLARENLYIQNGLRCAFHVGTLCEVAAYVFGTLRFNYRITESEYTHVEEEKTK